MSKFRSLGFATILVVISCGGGKPAAESPTTPASEHSAAKLSEAPTDAPATSEARAASAKGSEPRTMTIDLVAKSGAKVTGKLTLTEETSGVKLVLTLEGATPGDHGAHVHETPDCSAPDAKSAGSHYNPDKHAHGLPDAKERHLGDLGNIVVGKDGKGTLEAMIQDANLKANDPHSFVGRSIIVHEKKDDGGQPVGNAGGRIACAVIPEAPRVDGPTPTPTGAASEGRSENASAAAAARRPLMDRLFAPTMAYMINEASSTFVGRQQCIEKFPEDMPAQAACKQKEREKFYADVLVFEKKDDAVFFVIYKRSGSSLVETARSKVKQGKDDPDRVSLTVVSDKGTRTIFAGKNAITVDSESDSSIRVEDPKYGKLIYEARIGLINQDGNK